MIHRLTSRSLRCSLGLVLICGVVLSDGAETYSVLGREIPGDVMRKAYKKLFPRYIVDPTSRGCVSAKSKGATALQGVVENVSGQHVIIRTDTDLVAIREFRGPRPPVGESVSLMVIPSGTATHSYRTEGAPRTSIPQCTDVSMSFDEFATFLRDGQHFPEARELKTRANQKGLFGRKSGFDKSRGALR